VDLFWASATLPVGLGVECAEGGGVVEGFEASAVEGAVVVVQGFQRLKVGALGQPQPMLVVWQPGADSNSPLAQRSVSHVSRDNVVRMIESLLRLSPVEIAPGASSRKNLAIAWPLPASTASPTG
jgi:hypothetical protein